MSIRDTDACQNCGQDFADHDYVKDSIDKYKCPYPRQVVTYGRFHGSDPRDWHPDGECCSTDELEKHREACERWDMGDTTPEILSGLGVNTAEHDQFFEPREHDDPSEDS